MSPELKGFIIGATIPLIGIVINAVVQLVNSRQQRKTDNEIKYREALFKLAFDYWQNESPAEPNQSPLKNIWFVWIACMPFLLRKDLRKKRLMPNFAPSIY